MPADRVSTALSRNALLSFRVTLAESFPGNPITQPSVAFFAATNSACSAIPAFLNNPNTDHFVLTTTEFNLSADIDDVALLEQFRIATLLLESVAADRTLLDRLPAEDRQRLHRAVAGAYHPDPVVLRQRLKAAERQKNSSQISKDEELLNATGIRKLRAKPVFTTPNVFPPEGFIACDSDDDNPERREAIEPQHCYVCKQKYTAIHHFSISA